MRRVEHVSAVLDLCNYAARLWLDLKRSCVEDGKSWRCKEEGGSLSRRGGFLCNPFFLRSGVQAIMAAKAKTKLNFTASETVADCLQC